MRLRADDIKFLFNNVTVGTRAQFINEPVKATVEPDGSRYVEVHDPLYRTVEEFHSDAPAPISITAKVSKVITDARVNTSDVRTRSGMPTKINGAQEPAQPLETLAPQDATVAVPDEVQQPVETTAPQTDANRS